VNIFLVGATGFVGSHLRRTLAADGHGLLCPSRRPATELPAATDSVEYFTADSTSPETFQHRLDSVDAVINLAGIIRENPKRGQTFWRVHVGVTRALLEAAIAMKVPRFIQMSALGADPSGKTTYYRTKAEAERLVQLSELSYTIVRPSIILGSNSEFLAMLGRLVRYLPIVPIVGKGDMRFQPVSIETVVNTFAMSLGSHRAVEKVYDLAGPEEITLYDFLALYSRLVGRKKFRSVSIPVPLVRTTARLASILPVFPISQDELTMLLEPTITRNMSVYEDLALDFAAPSEVLEQILKSKQ
jgi:NADH dehydrogenase